MNEDEGDLVCQVTEFVQNRWTGTGQMVGVKHNVHGLAYIMAPVSRMIITAVMGQSFDDNILLSFTTTQIYDAISTYAAGDIAKKALLHEEYDTYTGGIHGDYIAKMASTRDMVENKVALKIKKMDSETKNVPLRRLISVLQERADFPTDRAW